MDILEQAQYPDLKQVNSICEELADSYVKTGRTDEAKKIMEHGRAALVKYDDIHNNEAA